MAHDFDRQYWEAHWDQRPTSQQPPADAEANPYVIRETADLPRGTALDAGCGSGVEALRLAAAGWTVTGADISRIALERAAERAGAGSAGVAAVGEPIVPVTWVEADLTVWQPAAPFDLVTTNYAHPTIAQLAFYARISRWVAPGGTLLIVGHLQSEEDAHDHDGHPAEASVTAADIAAILDDSSWRIDTASEQSREVLTRHGTRMLRDAVVRATRIGAA